MTERDPDDISDLVDKMQSSNVFMTLLPQEVNADTIDVKIALEIGVAVLLDKPIILAVRPGTRVPDKLVRASDRIVEFDPSREDLLEHIGKAVFDLLEKEDDESC